MKNFINDGSYKPCPVCGSHLVNYNGYGFASIVCNYCGFAIHSDDIYNGEKCKKEWNMLSDIDKLIEMENAKIELANKNIKECNDTKKHFLDIKEQIRKRKEELSSINNE